MFSNSANWTKKGWKNFTIKKVTKFFEEKWEAFKILKGKLLSDHQDAWSSNVTSTHLHKVHRHSCSTWTRDISSPCSEHIRCCHTCLSEVIGVTADKGFPLSTPRSTPKEKQSKEKNKVLLLHTRCSTVVSNIEEKELPHVMLPK